MSRNSVRVSAPPRSIFAVLDDACAYPRWVVGARRIRRVDDDWPAVGSRFHHALGTTVGELHDWSEIIERDPPHHLVLEVCFRPTGVARVELTIVADGDESVVTIAEEPVSGPAALLPGIVVEPLLTLRNALSLQRLRHEVERRCAPVG
jgi:uncharacterized protein YndB with AHSA1/START domain